SVLARIPPVVFGQDCSFLPRDNFDLTGHLTNSWRVTVHDLRHLCKGLHVDRVSGITACSPEGCLLCGVDRGLLWRNLCIELCEIGALKDRLVILDECTPELGRWMAESSLEQIVSFLDHQVS